MHTTGTMSNAGNDFVRNAIPLNTPHNIAHRQLWELANFQPVEIAASTNTMNMASTWSVEVLPEASSMRWPLIENNNPEKMPTSRERNSVPNQRTKPAPNMESNMEGIRTASGIAPNTLIDAAMHHNATGGLCN